MTLILAGHEVVEPMDIWADYARHQGRTVERYDLPGPGDPAALTREEVWRSRAIASRITHRECEELPEVWRAAGGAALPADARIQDADPLERGGLYDLAQRVVEPFVARRGIRYTKAYKVLHVKRPALFPILDRQLRLLYAESEAAYRCRHRADLPTGFNYWGAIRRDVVDNQAALDDYRGKLAGAGEELAGLARLSDVRLLDMLCWRLAKRR